MELIKDIYFNTDKLIENTKVKVSYTGKFYQGNNNKVFIHYGYGENWDNINEIEMVKTDLGYQTELDLIGSNTLNFCFKNQNNEWDNNCGKNYIFNIEKSTNNIDNIDQINFSEKSNNTVSFFGKPFGKVDENKTISNVYWNTNESQNSNVENSGIIEDSMMEIPNSIDTFIQSNSNTPQNMESLSKLDSKVQPSIDFGNSIQANSFNIINPTLDNNLTSSATKIFDNNSVTSSVINNSVVNNEVTAISVVNTSFQKTLIWTRKVKTSVCKFFSYVPKLISGNYKRKIENKKQ